MTDLRGEQDTDMLTDMELEERGLEPRFPEPTSLRSIKEPPPQPEHRCHFCGRKVKNPVTKHEVAGYDFVPEGKHAHSGCAQRQVDAVLKYLKQTDEEE